MIGVMVGRGAAEPGGKARTDGEKYRRARHQHEEDGRREAGREVPQDAEEGVEEALARALARVRTMRSGAKSVAMKSGV